MVLKTDLKHVIECLTAPELKLSQSKRVDTTCTLISLTW